MEWNELRDIIWRYTKSLLSENPLIIMAGAHHGEVCIDKFKTYYDSNYLATIFAPLFPHLSRNCIWELKFNPERNPRLFPSLKDVEGPWGSSSKWQELLI